MKKSSNNAVTMLVVVVALALAAAAYFGVYKNLLTEQADARAETEIVESGNAQLLVQLADLQERYGNIEDTKSELEQVRQELSPAEDYQDVRRMISELATQYGVTLTGDTLEVPRYIQPAGSFVAAASTVGETSYTEGIQFTGLFATTVELKLQGTYENVLKFVTALQYGDHRYLLVTANDLTPILGVVPESGSADASDLLLDVTFFTIDMTRIPADPSAVNAGSGIAPGTAGATPAPSEAPVAPSGAAVPSPSAATSSASPTP